MKNVMRGRKGFSLIELLSVFLIIALIIALISLFALDEINNARGNARVAEARFVYVAAHTVITENRYLGDIDDNVYMEGLTGVCNDASLPVQTMLSSRLAMLLAPDIVLSAVPEAGKGCAAFEVKNSEIVSLKYQTVTGSRLYTITIVDHETIVESERIKK